MNKGVSANISSDGWPGITKAQIGSTETMIEGFGNGISGDPAFGVKSGIVRGKDIV